MTEHLFHLVLRAKDNLEAALAASDLEESPLKYLVALQQHFCIPLKLRVQWRGELNRASTVNSFCRRRSRTLLLKEI